jgi:hypothetical protein
MKGRCPASIGPRYEITWPRIQSDGQFLDDIHNPFSVEVPWWLFNRIFTEPRLKRRFIRGEEPIQWQSGAMTQFEQDLVNVQESLLFCCHMTGGPPRQYSITRSALTASFYTALLLSVGGV